MNPYEALANAIIEQAAKDHKKAAKFLKKNRRTKELSEIVAAQVAAKQKRREERKALKLPAEREKLSREERKLNAIISHETLRYDTEKFFRSDWFGELTELDGEVLLSRLKQMEEAM